MNQGYYPQQMQQPQQAQGFYQPPQQPYAPPQMQAQTNPAYQGMQPQGYAPPQMQAPTAQQGYFGPPQQVQAPMQQPVAMMQPQMNAPPVLHHIDDAAALEEYARVKEDLRTSGLAGFLNVPGPNGESNWDNVRPGQEGSVLVHICGPWEAGKDYKVMQSSHFFKSAAHPQGASVSHDEGCRFCASLNAMPKEHQERLKPWKRVRTRYLYNVCWLENLAAHYQNGQYQAMILPATKTLHTHLGTLFGEAGGVSRVVDYQAGRPVRIIKRKTGSQSYDIEWAAVATFEARPLPQEFWPVAANLVDLEKLVKVSTNEEIDAALAELGVTPVPVAQSYQPGAQPPHASPYVVQGMQQPGQPQPNVYMAPEMIQQAMGQQPAQPRVETPPYWPNNQTPPQYQEGAMPSFSSAPQMPQSHLPPQQMPPQTPMVQPPAMPAPPPVTSGATAPSQYQPQPSQLQGQAQVAPQPMAQQPGQPMAQNPDTPRALTYPLAPNERLPKDRQKCFGSFSGSTDVWCAECLEWLRSQCMTASAQLAQQQQGQQLAALQNQLVGG